MKFFHKLKISINEPLFFWKASLNVPSFGTYTIIVYYLNWLNNLRHQTVFWPKFNRWELYYFLIQHFLLIFRITPKDITVFRLYRSTIWSIFRTQQLQMKKMYCKAPNLLPQWNSLGILDIMHSQLPNNGILKQSHYII